MREIYEYIKDLFEENLKLPRGKRKRCITIANYAIVETYREFYDKDLCPGGRVGPVDIKYFESQEIVEKVTTYYPVDAKGKITYGINAPVKFMDDIQNELRMHTPIGGVEYYYVSIMDGYHVVMLISRQIEDELDEFLLLDNNEIVDMNAIREPTFDDYLAKFYQENWEKYRQDHNGNKSKTPLVIARLHFPE